MVVIKQLRQYKIQNRDIRPKNDFKTTFRRLSQICL